MEAYSKYKQSGVEAIGKVPVKWTVTLIKNTLEIPITDGPHTTPELYDEGIPFISAESIKNGKIDFERKRGNISVEDYELFSKKYIPQRNDIYMVKSGATTGNVAMVEIDEIFTIWSPLAVFRAKQNKILPKYLHFYLQSNNFKSLVELNWSYGTQQNIGMGVLSNLPITYPNLSEQTTIASFLNHKTTQIDTLIEKKEQLIEKLKLQRQAIINEAVTKGINPETPMKDCGIEGLGEIPKHWEIKKAKYLLNEENGIKIGPFGSALKLDTLVESGIKIYGQGNVIKDDFSIGGRFLPIDRFEEDFTQYEILEGDVLVTMMGTTGKSKVFRKEFERGILDSHLLRLRFDENKFISYLFSVILEQSDYISQQIVLMSRGSIMAGLNSTIIKELKILVPPIQEQKYLLEFISQDSKKIDEAVEKTLLSIEKLKRYRQSIISEAVTGKIDVRDWKNV
jgi:type I restriction enzyme, S subunit